MWNKVEMSRDRDNLDWSQIRAVTSSPEIGGRGHQVEVNVEKRPEELPPSQSPTSSQSRLLVVSPEAGVIRTDDPAQLQPPPPLVIISLIDINRNVSEPQSASTSFDEFVHRNYARRTGIRRLSPSSSSTDSSLSSTLNFQSRASRGAFLRKVLAILGCQLILAVIWTLICIHVEVIGKFVHKWYWITFIALGLYVSLFVAVGFFKVGRKCPANIIILLIYTGSVAYICGYVTMQYSTWIVLMTLGATLLTFLSLSLVSLLTKIDVTGWGIYLTLATCLFMLYVSVVFLCSILLKDLKALSVLNITGAFVGACLVSIYLLYDIQMIMGGRRAEVEEDEWLFASMSIFYDLIMIFVHLLHIIGLFRRCHGSCHG